MSHALASPELANELKIKTVEAEIIKLIFSELIGGKTECLILEYAVHSTFGDMLMEKYPALDVKFTRNKFYISLKKVPVPVKKELPVQEKKELPVQEKKELFDQEKKKQPVQEKSSSIDIKVKDSILNGENKDNMKTIFKQNMERVQLDVLKKQVIDTPMCIFSVRLTNWNFGPISQGNIDIMKSYGYIISEYSDSITLTWMPDQKGPLKTEEQLKFIRKMEITQFDELKKYVIGTEKSVFDITIKSWKFGKIAEFNKKHLKDFGYNITEFSDSIRLFWSPK